MKIAKEVLRLICLLVLVSTTVRCGINENGDDCPPPEPEMTTLDFTVRAYHNTGTELTQQDVRDVILYLFDDGLHFIKVADAMVGETTSVEVPAGIDIHAFGWGNLGDSNQVCTNPEVGMHMSEFCVDLVDHTFTRASTPVRSPDDLFRGYVGVYKEQQDGENLIALSREVGSMTVTIRGLKAYTGFPDDDYSIVVQGMSNTVDFAGDQTGDETTYHPTGSFGGNGVASEYYVPVFNMLPSSGMQIDLYHGTELLDSVTTDSSGKYIHVGQGIQTNILIEYGVDPNGEASLRVRMSVTDWGVNELWKEF